MPSEGGKCATCGRLLCLSHFAVLSPKPICASCQPPSKTKRFGWVFAVFASALLAFGVLAILSGIYGSEVIRFGRSEHRYYQIVATPLPHFWLWGAIGILSGIVIFVLLFRNRRRRR